MVLWADLIQPKISNSKLMEGLTPQVGSKREVAAETVPSSNISTSRGSFQPIWRAVHPVNRHRVEAEISGARLALRT